MGSLALRCSSKYRDSEEKRKRFLQRFCRLLFPNIRAWRLTQILSESSSHRIDSEILRVLRDFILLYFLARYQIHNEAYCWFIPHDLYSKRYNTSFIVESLIYPLCTV